MTQYVRHIHSAQRVIDFVDVDSDKWRQYAETKPWPLSWIYQRESTLLQNYEKDVAQEFDKSTFVSLKEAALFKMMMPEVADKVDYFNNGVDTDYFSPIHQFPNPYTTDNRILVFTGAMDYWANIDAVEWFVQKVFPIVRSQVADIKFYIVGSNPAARVLALTKIPGVTVTGKVEDIRPYLKYASIAIAPLRIARGIQNKVLEAMAMGKRVILSPQAMEGIQAIDGEELYVATDEITFAGKIINLISEESDVEMNAARSRILSDYTWSASFTRFDQLFMST
jgi:sugar transferase (PEP-CTERM/EpsH1 system associated)